MMIPETLKNKWQRATWRASTLSETIEANRPVTVVPMLAPRVNGNIYKNVDFDELVVIQK